MTRKIAAPTDWSVEPHSTRLLTLSPEQLAELYPDKQLYTLKRAKYNLLKRANLPTAPIVAPVVNNNVQTVKAIDEPEIATDKDREILRLREQKKLLETKYNIELTRNSGFEQIKSVLESVIAEHESVPVPPPRKSDANLSEEDAVLCLSDLHVGEVVDIRQTGGIAVYNLDVAKKRLDYTIDSAIKITKGNLANGYNIKTLHVFMLGDLVSGEIHDELKESNEVGVINQVLYTVNILEENIKKLCREFEHVHITSVVGNHGRKKEEYYFKDKAIENFDYLISKYLQKLLSSQPNLTWNIPETYWAIQEVQNKKYLLMHGDGIKSWNGMPFYGLSRAFKTWRPLAENYIGGFNDMVVAHFHNPNIFTVGADKLIMNGCFKGGDEYSLGAISAACDPVQYLWGVHPKHGMTWTFEINSKDIR